MDSCSRSALGRRFWRTLTSQQDGAPRLPKRHQLRPLPWWAPLIPGSFPSYTPPGIASPIHSLQRALVWGPRLRHPWGGALGSSLEQGEAQLPVSPHSRRAQGFAIHFTGDTPGATHSGPR